jgi:DNA invertase Pin-like site-specific DNA recombinase
MSTTDKPLRFAALVRVSTEKQEKKGESLAVQRSSIERDVSGLGGAVALWYGGQEHATPGREKKEVDRLLADAARGRFDAVIVAYPDRWSRDNAKSKEGLEVFRQHGVRFYVGTTPMDLFDPNVRFVLGVHAEVGELLAGLSSKKSIDTRIERAHQGRPTCGALPFGRTWDETAGWGVDPAKQAMIADVAARYLAGASLPAQAREYGVNHSSLVKSLRERCGTVWVQEFHDRRLNVHARVPTVVPRLLPEETIAAVRARLTAVRERLRKGGVRKHDYLLTGFVFCATCGHALIGEPDRHGVLHYAHTHHESWVEGRTGSRHCPARPRPSPVAAKLETDVLRELFRLFGNPAAIERAVNAAAPDRERLLEARRRLGDDLAGIRKGRQTVLGLILKGKVTEADAEPQLEEARQREEVLQRELDKLDADLAGVPDEKAVRRYVDYFEGYVPPLPILDEREEGDASQTIFVYDDEGNEYAGGNNPATWRALTRDDKRHLIEAAFGTTRPGDPPSGVYVSVPGLSLPSRRKRHVFTLRGLLPFEWVVSCARY